MKVSDDEETGGKFVIELSVEAQNSDIYIPSDADFSKYRYSGNAGFFLGFTSGYFPLGTYTWNVESSATKPNKQFRIQESGSETFTISLEKAGEVESGTYGIELEQINYYTDGAKQSNVESMYVRGDGFESGEVTR